MHTLRPMSRITYTKSAKTLLKGAAHLLVIAPAKAFEDGSFLQVLPEDLMRLALDLASDTKPGRTGSTASTLTGSDPRRLTIGVLPDEVSRHNAASRPAWVNGVTARAGLSGRCAVLLALDDPEHYTAAANAVGRAFPLFHQTKVKKKGADISILAVGPDGEALSASASVKETVTAAREAARLVDVPPTDMNPKRMQADAWKALTGIPKVRKRAIIGSALLDAKLGGVHGVGRTALDAPRVLIATYDPGKKRAKHIALVGKGVTYDTGGLNIKTGGHMSTMKSDMGGAAAVLGAFRVLATTGCKHKVTVIACLAENAIGPSAYKPDDVLTMHSGLTVEVNNTDAEGRILLADGVSLAARKLGADIVIDAATLTGAQLIATGRNHAAIVSNDADLEATVVAAGQASGDLVHPLPFAPEFYKGEFSSTVADMRNSVSDRMNAQASCAAQFVYWHMEDTDAKWCHVDLAGPAFPKKRGSGYGVALLAEAVRRL